MIESAAADTGPPERGPDAVVDLDSVGSGTADDAARVAADTQEALATHLLGGRIAADAGQLGVAAVAIWLFREVLSTQIAVGWMTLFAIGVVVRTVLRTRSITPDTPAYVIVRIVRADVWVGAAMWGALALLVMGAPVVTMAMLATIFAGLVAAATSSLVADRRAFFGFAGLLLGPLAVSVILPVRDREHVALFVLILLFGPFMVVAYRRAFRILSTQVRLAAQLRISEEESVRSRDFLDELVSSAPSPIVVLEASGAILQANPAFHSATGREGEGLTGVSFVALVTEPGPERESLADYLRTVQEGRRSVAELPLLRADGSELWMRLSGTRPGGMAEGTLILVGEDVTGQVLARAVQERARREAEAAARAKTAFLASMSHEIRTPLHGVLGMVDVLLDSKLSERQREVGEVIRTSGQGLLRILNDVLDVSKIEAGQLDLEKIEFDLHRVLKDTARLMVPRAERGRNVLRVEIGTGVPKQVVGDPGRIAQIVTNLLDNAVKFTVDGEVVLSVVDKGRTDGGRLLAFNVADTGVGIPPEKQELIFDEFEQADTSTTRTHGGTGLGLTISRRLVGLLGGRLEVRSAPGEGSEFFFTLTVDLPGMLPGGRRRTTDAGDGFGGRRFLVVDDNATSRRVAREALVHVGADRVVEAPDVVGGLEILLAGERDGAPFDAVVLDHVMPERDGFDFVRGMKEESSVASTPVLMMSSAGGGDLRRQARELGVDGLLRKPVTRGDLVRAMKALLDREAYDGPERRLVTSETLTRLPRRPRVLVAEDNAVNRQVVVTALERRGYDVDAVVDGERAVAAAEDVIYDVILMDIQMPRLDGLEATRRIRQLPDGVDVPIVALTAHAFAEERERCAAAGMNDFLTKPFRPDDLFELLERWAPKAAGAETRRGNGGRGVHAEAEAEVEADDPLWDSPPVDVEGFRAVMREAGIEEVVDETLELYRDEAADLFRRLAQAVDSADTEAVRSIAHGLKAASGNVRANRLNELLGDLEMKGRSGDEAGVRSSFALVAEEYRRVMDFLDA